MRKYYITMLLWKYYVTMNTFQRKFLKLQCKESTSKKKELIRLHSDSDSAALLNFLPKILDEHL